MVVIEDENGGLDKRSAEQTPEATKSLPYACSCCGYWNWDMFEDWVISERIKAKQRRKR